MEEEIKHEVVRALENLLKFAKGRDAADFVNSDGGYRDLKSETLLASDGSLFRVLVKMETVLEPILTPEEMKNWKDE